jgi:hypothetical protein
MGATPTYAWPYPEPTDPVAAGADNIKALGLAIEPTMKGANDAIALHHTRLAAIEKQKSHQLFTWGRTGVNTTDVNGDIAIPYDGMAFTGTPVVTVSSGQTYPLVQFVVNNAWTNAYAVYVRCFNSGGAPIPNGSVTWNIQVTGQLA